MEIDNNQIIDDLIECFDTHMSCDYPFTHCNTIADIRRELFRTVDLEITCSINIPVIKTIFQYCENNAIELEDLFEIVIPIILQKNEWSY